MLCNGVEHIKTIGIPGYGDDEVGFMERTVTSIRPRFIGDWGTNRGSSSRIWFELSRLWGYSPAIVTVDLPIVIAALDRDHAGTSTGLYVRNIDRIQKKNGDGVTEALASFVEFGSPERAIFFVDGYHHYHNVYRELESLYRIAPKATLVLHDTRSDPGEALKSFIGFNPGSYEVEWLESQAGMARATPIAG